MRNRFGVGRLALLLIVGLGVLRSAPSVTAQDIPTTTPFVVPTQAAPPVRPVPQITTTDERATLLLYFGSLSQGSVGVAHITGAGVTSARMRFLSRVTDFYAGDDGLYVLVPVGLNVTPREYALSASVQYADGTRSTLEVRVPVADGGFARQAFTVGGERAYLTSPEIERNEYARMDSIFAQSSLERLWDEQGFQLPLASEITSPFGSFRTLNQNTQTRHTGWDLRAVPGTPIQASAGGVVAFAGPLDIRGNHVIVDHGYGVFSGYSHLSQILVTRGQTVEFGQIIGASGNTGRSNGPHLHWEIAVNGEWIDSLAFTQMWLP
jgi:murein DD-endopeptidase MepM/ murein hydrolase activator NlpD